MKSSGLLYKLIYLFQNKDKNVFSVYSVLYVVQGYLNLFLLVIIHFVYLLDGYIITYIVAIVVVFIKEYTVYIANSLCFFIYFILLYHVLKLIKCSIVF